MTDKARRRVGFRIATALALFGVGLALFQTILGGFALAATVLAVEIIASAILTAWRLTRRHRRHRKQDYYDN